MIRDSGKVKDHFKQFKEKRETIRIPFEKEEERLQNLFKMLAFSIRSDPGYLKALAKDRENVQEMSSSTSSSIADGQCACCKAPLSSSKYFGMGSSSAKRCPLCSKIVCRKCITNQMTVDPISMNQTPQSVYICDNCFRILKRAKNKQTVKARAKAIESHPLLIYQRQLVYCVHVIEEDFSEFKKLLESIGDEHTEQNHEDIQFALRKDSDLDTMFQRFDSALKKFNSIVRSLSSKEIVLHGNIKTHVLQFLQDTLPSYKILHKHLHALAAMSPVKTSSRGPPPLQVPSMVPRDSSETLRLAPVIVSVAPIFIPLHGGTRITITGENFSSRVRVSIDHVQNVPCQYVDSQELVILEAPAFSEEGFKMVQVANPDGSTAALNDVLYYSKDAQVLDKSRSGPFALESSPFPERLPADPFRPGPPRDRLSIDSVVPAVSPLSGGQHMKVTGTGLVEGIGVRVAGQEVNYRVTKEGEMIEFDSPAATSEGFKDVEVYQSSSSTSARPDCFALRNVLFYTRQLAEPDEKLARQITDHSSIDSAHNDYNYAAEKDSAHSLLSSAQADVSRRNPPTRIWGGGTNKQQ